MADKAIPVKKPDKPQSGKPADLAVFSPVRDTACAECNEPVIDGDFLFMEKERPLCMECADMDHLVYLPRGDVALTRRSRKYSKLSAVVLRWSRARKQYERQGLLVEEEALERAELECVLDADKREHTRRRNRVRAAQADSNYVREFTAKIRDQYPGCPAKSAEAIASHACQKYSGRVGRSAAAKEFSEKAIRLAVQAHIRHVYTDYDELLLQGETRFDAREEVYDKVQETLEKWRGA